MKYIKSALWLTSILVIIFIALFAFTGRIRVVTGGSMEPTYQPGDVLFVGFTPRSIEPGMIICYQYQSKNVTHRVLSINPDGSLIMKGDNNYKVDPHPVISEQILGEPFLHIPRLGHFFKFIREPLGFSLFIILPVCLIVLDRILDIFKSAQRQLE